jgi:broad specificity phosphatase PhoE
MSLAPASSGLARTARVLRLIPLLAAAACAPAAGVPASPPAAASASVAATSASRATPTTVIVVRHAERARVEGSDPPLDSIGGVRAAMLRDVLRDAGVGAVYTTQLQRTRLTAEPLVRHLGLAPIVVSTGGSAEAHVAEVARRVLAEQAGRVVLVVGHSNTVPGIVRALGGAAPDQLPDTAYEDLFIVTVPAQGASSGAVRTIRARYGPPNPVGSGGRMPH